MKFKKLKNYTFGIFRNPEEFFYEVDNHNRKFIPFCKSKFSKYSIWRTKKGFHLRAKDEKHLPQNYNKLWNLFQKNFPSNYKRDNRKFSSKGIEYFHTPATLRISPKYNALTHKVVSPAPIFVCGNWLAYWKNSKSECQRELIRYWCS